MFVLEANDLQGMLADAFKVLTDKEDREQLKSLHSSVAEIEREKWDLPAMATLLAKAGKMHEAEVVLAAVLNDKDRARAAYQMALARLEAKDIPEVLALLKIAQMNAASVQDKESSYAHSLLEKVANQYAQLSETQRAIETAQSIADAKEREKLLNSLKTSGKK